jgi:hypothetical protein
MANELDGSTDSREHRHTLRSLQVRNFRVFLAGQTASQSGMWLHVVGLAWLAEGLTGSGSAIAWVTVAMFGPLLVFGPWTGALADRAAKYWLLITTQVLIAGASAALGAAVLAGANSMALVYGLTLVTDFSTPSRRRPAGPSSQNSSARIESRTR